MSFLLSSYDRIFDSAIHRQNADSVGGANDGQTVDPWPDLIGSMDLDAIGAPTLQVGSLNGKDAVLTDGTNDAYQYNTNLSGTLTEPATLIFALRIGSLSGTHNVWRDEAENVNEVHVDDSQGYRLGIGTEGAYGGAAQTGDQIITMAANDSQAILRVNGTEIVSIPSSANEIILDGGNGGYYGADIANNRRYLNALWREPIVHNERLSGAKLADEEQRLENEANMSVL